MPDGEGGGDADVKGVFCAVLGDFETKIGGIDYGWVYAMDFVAGYDGVASVGRWAEIGKRDGVLDLFESADGEAVGAEGFYGFER